MTTIVAQLKFPIILRKMIPADIGKRFVNPALQLRQVDDPRVLNVYSGGLAPERRGRIFLRDMGRILT